MCTYIIRSSMRRCENDNEYKGGTIQVSKREKKKKREEEDTREGGHSIHDLDIRYRDSMLKDKRRKEGGIRDSAGKGGQQNRPGAETSGW